MAPGSSVHALQSLAGKDLAAYIRGTHSSLFDHFDCDSLFVIFSPLSAQDLHL